MLVESVLGIGVGFQYSSEMSKFNRRQAYYLCRSLGVSPTEEAMRSPIISQSAVVGRVSGAFADLGSVKPIRDALDGAEAVAIYLGQGLSFEGLMEIGDPVNVSLEVIDIKPDRKIITARACCRLENGDIVAQGNGTVLMTRPGEKAPSNGKEGIDDSDGGDEVTDLKVFWYGIGGQDFNVAHLDPEEASKGYFGAPVSHGGRSLDLVLVEYGKQFKRPCVGLNVKYEAPVFFGDRLRPILDIDLEKGDQGQDVIPYKVLKQRGISIAKGQLITLG